MTDISYFILQLSLNDFRPAFVKTNCKSISSASPTKQGNLTQTDTHFKCFVGRKNKPHRKIVFREFGFLWVNLKICIRFLCITIPHQLLFPLPVKLQKSSHSQAPWTQYLPNFTNKKKTQWALRCCLMVLWFGIVDSLKVLRSIFINIYSLFCSSIYQFYSWIMWYMHISSSPNTSKCPAFLKRHFSHSLVSQLF